MEKPFCDGVTDVLGDCFIFQNRRKKISCINDKQKLLQNKNTFHEDACRPFNLEVGEGPVRGCLLGSRVCLANVCFIVSVS